MVCLATSSAPENCPLGAVCARVLIVSLHPSQHASGRYQPKEIESIEGRREGRETNSGWPTTTWAAPPAEPESKLRRRSAWLDLVCIVV